eukprot:TRINITY_DN12113_c0_g1_i1.p1 TRINITY_DN12113_c0_g1~~TRINITY_DN12113_c0_g1_i1.p1  ORF type:complete len:135 (-),score=24.43 TRINITY_DN12113_c0_g1_i1:67-471(-)
MVAPRKTRVPVLKKTKKDFCRFNSDRFKRVKPAWRTPHGIDNRMRRKFRGNRPLPQIGYGSDRRTKFIRPNKFKTFVVHNAQELDLLMMSHRKYAAEVAAAVGQRTRALIVERARQLDIKVTNEFARLRREENE